LDALIKSGSRAASRSGEAANVKPVDLTPIGLHLDNDFEADMDLSLIRDPVLRARIEARGVVRGAQQEADGIRQEAHDEGCRSGLAEAAQAVNELIQRLESDIRQIASDRAEVLDAIEPQVLKLCMEIVEKVIRHEARTDPQIVMRAVKSCLRRIKDSEQVCLHISPDEVEAVKARRNELIGLAEGAGELRIVDDRRVSPGGCVVESSAGDYDAKVESQLAKIDEKLRETLRNDHDDEPPAEYREVLSGDQPA
jgi:flagellar biosynthesis/type III secretory pathway protein FliH